MGYRKIKESAKRTMVGRTIEIYCQIIHYKYQDKIRHRINKIYIIYLENKYHYKQFLLLASVKQTSGFWK